jgi:hypothetical protein
MYIYFSMVKEPLVGQGLLIIEASRSHSYRHTTPRTTPVDEWSARHRGFYLTTHNAHTRQKSMPPARFDPAVPARKRPQTHAWDRVATGIRIRCILVVLKHIKRRIKLILGDICKIWSPGVGYIFYIDLTVICFICHTENIWRLAVWWSWFFHILYLDILLTCSDFYYIIVRFIILEIFVMKSVYR